MATSSPASRSLAAICRPIRPAPIHPILGCSSARYAITTSLLHSPTAVTAAPAPDHSAEIITIVCILVAPDPSGRCTSLGRAGGVGQVDDHPDAVAEPGGMADMCAYRPPVR